jgi:hypothetical protein
MSDNAMIVVALGLAALVYFGVIAWVGAMP